MKPGVDRNQQAGHPRREITCQEQSGVRHVLLGDHPPERRSIGELLEHRGGRRSSGLRPPRHAPKQRVRRDGARRERVDFLSQTTELERSRARDA